MHWNAFAVGPLLCGALAFAVAGLIWSGQVRARAAPGPTYAPVASCVGFWSLAVALLSCIDEAPAGVFVTRLTLTAIIAAGFFAMRFALHFVRAARRRLWLGLSIAAFVIGVAQVWLDPALVVGVYFPSWGGVYPRLGERWWLMFALALGGVVGPALLILRLRLGLPPSRRRRQADYIIIAYGAAAMGGVDVLATLGVDMPPITWATATVSVLTFYYAMARWRLLDVRTAVHRTLFWGIVVAATIIPLYALAVATQGWAGWQAPWPRAIAVVVLMLGLVLWVARLSPLVQGFIARGAERQVHICGIFAVRAAEVASPSELPPLVDDALEELSGMRCRAVALHIDAGGQRVEMVLPEGAPPPPVSLELGVPREPCARGELEPEVFAADRDAAALLDAYDADALLPLRHGDAVVGVIAARGHGRRVLMLDERTRDGLARLADRAAVGFINAALEEALARRSARLAEEVAERTRELAQAVDDLKAAQAQLVQAERQSSLGVLVAGVSHEINNALNFIFGNLPVLAKYVDDYADLLARASAAGAGPRPETLRRAEDARQKLPGMLAGIEEAAHRARAIVGDLRRFARADDAERRATDIREGLESTLNLLGPELDGRVEVRCELAPDLPAVDGYPAALNHVFLNVLLNASQAVGAGGRITVRARRAGDGRVEIAITDTGAGVPDDARERVFEPFYTTRPGAAGLGLTVSRQIIARHGGAISIGRDPEVGGARVTMVLPAAV
jgi:signal transduction histidine kinase